MTGDARWTVEHEGASAHAGVRCAPDGEPTLEVTATAPGAADEALERDLAAVRRASSLSMLRAHALEGAYRIEDAVEVEARVAPGDAGVARGWTGRRFAGARVVEDGAMKAAGGAGLRVVLARRGALPTSQRRRYARVEGRVRVEAFELHVVEHCNLRCAHCCNMSPYLPERVLGVEAIEATCRAMAAHLDVDVFKIMGGEPLLHPDPTGVLQAVRRSGISGTVRLFTNGLLLHRMDDDFWRALDHLTISAYASAPVKPAMVDDARAKARRFGVVLNVKPVDAFSEVMRDRREEDDGRVRETFEGCWLRHRCLVVRGGRFFMCTRAAYAPEFHATLLGHRYPSDLAASVAGDGVPLDTPDLGGALLAYLNGASPLAACRFCHGGDGPLAPHAQLSKGDVRDGRLRPLPVVRS